MELEGAKFHGKAEVPSLSILESKKQISDIEMAIDSYGEGNTVGMRNRQISSGIIVDWKQFEERGQVKSQLLLKDGQKDQKTIFSYVVEEWHDKQPAKVIYRWIRKPTKNHLDLSKNHLNLSKNPNLLEQEHIYRGPMKHFRKNGSGVYIILKKFSDNSEKTKRIEGEWVQDILKRGVMVDDSGKEQILSSNILKMPTNSKHGIAPYPEKNHAIEVIRKKSSLMIPSSKQILPMPSQPC